MGDSQHTQNIHVNKVIGENEKCVFYFTAKAKWTFQPTRYIPFFFFLRFYLFLERGRVGEREREKHQCVFASRVSPTGDRACNPGMCPDWE